MASRSMRIARSCAAVLVLAVAACGGDNAGVAPLDVPFTGTYTLKSVNGQNLPAVITQTASTSVSVVSDTLTIADGGTWTEHRIVETTSDGQTSRQFVPDGGTWLRAGNVLNLTSTENKLTAFSGTFTGTQLNFTDFAYPYVFTR